MATCPSCRKRYANHVTSCEVDGESLLPDEAFAGVDAEIAVGQQVGEYVIEGKIGEGGFGAVYRGVHPLIGKQAAIKVLNRQYSSNPQMVSRFIAEARAVNQIKNRNIIDIFSFGRLEDGRHYYVMELLEGVTFDRFLRDRGPLPLEEAIPIFRGMARALDAAHAAGIAHRDLKPENIFLAFDDDGGVYPKLLDFGIAKLLGESAMSGHKTRTGTPMGTPHYMSPEQCRGKNVDHRTDIYSFGIMIHQCLTGQLPFDADDVMSILVKHTTAPAPRMSEVLPQLSADLDAPVLQMLEKEPEKRPVTISAAVEALASAGAAAGYAVSAAPARSGPRKSGDGSQIVASGKGLTPAEIGSLAEARTVVGGETPKNTLAAAATDVGRARPARSTPIVIAALALVVGIAGGAGALFLRKGTPSAAAETPVKTSAVAATSVAPPVTAAPTVSATATAAVQPGPAADIEVTIQTKPPLPKAEVFLGDEKLGLVGAPLRLKRGDAEVTLTIKAPGFRPEPVRLTPTQSTVLSLKLDPVAGVVKKKSELEY
jgi:serine/threonine-protein kinase